MYEIYPRIVSGHQHLQEALSTAQRSEEKLCWEADLSTHPTQTGA